MIANANSTNNFSGQAKADEVLQAGTVIPATLITRVTSDNSNSVVTAFPSPLGDCLI